MVLKPIATIMATACQPKLNGKKPRGEQMGGHTRGGKKSQPLTGHGMILAIPIVVLPGPHPLGALKQVKALLAFMIWLAMCGNGSMIGMILIITKVQGMSRIRKVLL